MTAGSILEDLTGALHSSPDLLRKIGGRVIQDGHALDDDLPAVVVDVIPGERGQRVQITCRARTSGEADDLGAAVVRALSRVPDHPDHRKWVKVGDRSSYEHARRAYRRILSIDLRR